MIKANGSRVSKTSQDGSQANKRFRSAATVKHYASIIDGSDTVCHIEASVVVHFNVEFNIIRGGVRELLM